MEQFGKYQLVRRVGAGGMAEVYLARTVVAQGLNKQLVIKKIHPAYARSKQFVAMFVDEAKIALSLNHPNIVQVFDFGQVGQTFFLAMEYIEGIDVLRVMQETAKAGEKVPLNIAAYIVQQLAKGLDYAHRKSDDYGDPLGIVHRDISPQNVLASWDGGVKIVDFGIARARDVKEQEGVIKGKFAYMAPEQARGILVDRRADVFSAGVVLFELACGRPLFPGKGKEVLELAKAGAIPSPRRINPEISEELESTILRTLTFDRDARFQTGRDLQNALGQFQFRWAQEHGGVPTDSGTLAQFLARVVPRDARPQRRAPSSSPGLPEISAKSHMATEASVPESDLSADLGTQPGKVQRKAVRERKPVFVLQALPAGLDKLEQQIGATAAKKVVADFQKIAKDIAFKHDAYFDESEEEGLRIIVGVPVAGEDDPSRTVRLSLALIEALDAIGQDVEPDLRLAVGVERGTAVVKRDSNGSYSHELEEGASSSASELAHEARGAELLVTLDVYRVTRDEWNFEPLGGTQATTADRVYRLRGPKERLQRLRERSEQVDLVGRDLELKALRDAYRDTLINGSHRLLVITGDPGIGKRSLVNALVQNIPRNEATIIRATARVATQYTPFGIIADFARDTMGLAEGAEPKEIQKRIEMLASVLWPNKTDTDEVRELVDASCLLFGIRREKSADFNSDELRVRLHQVALQVEQRFWPDAPLLIVAENVHWSDEQSLALTRDLVETSNSRGILVVVTSRPEPSIIKLASNTRADVMRLDELDEAGRQALIERRFPPGTDVRGLVKQILPRTGGNPYFITEVIDSLVEREVLIEEQAEGKPTGFLLWSQADEPVHVPTTVEALLVTRIDRLDASLKQTLVHASVLGSRFRTEELAAMIGTDCEKALGLLVERGLLRQEGKEHAFPNNMTMTVAYRMVTAEDRGDLHRKAASNAKNSSGYCPGQDDAFIARHLELAGDAKAASEYYLGAATHAIHVGSMGDAFHQLGRALKLLAHDDHGQRFRTHLRREEVLRRLSKRQAQLREIEALRTEADALNDVSKLATAHARLTEYNIEMGKLQAAEKSVGPALEFAREAGDSLAEAEALRLRSAILRLLGRSDEALAVCDEALAKCQDKPETLTEHALILNNRGTILWNMDRLNEAIEAYAEGLVIYRALRMPRFEARSLNNMGIVFSALGEPEEALAHYKSSLRIDQRLGDRQQIALKLGNIGQTYTEIGDGQRGEKYLLKALKLSEVNEDWIAMIDIINSLGQTYLNRGDLEQAREYLERGLGLATDNKHHYQEIRSLIYLGLTRIEQDDGIEVALRLAQRATEIAKKMPMPVGEMFGLAVQALALEKMGEFERGLQCSRDALVQLEKVEQGEGTERILWIHSKLCERSDKLDEAKEAIDRSHSEVARKAAKLGDHDLRACYLQDSTIAAICADYERLCGKPFN